MIAEHARDDGRQEPTKLLAFHYRGDYEQWTPLAGSVEVPALVHEVTQTITEDGTPLYEGRIFDAATRRLIHERPYQSTFLEAFARWWTRETELDPPEELIRGVHHCPAEDHNGENGERTEDT